ncbi:hypothetical protein FHT17_002634 [Novosphingobium sp. SG916]|nr:hypothetical protein [Novosphingobium sp. SG720]NMN05440.1 hypothetical protein [Novosphingobium sp. SG919]NMN87735.1 hypothetical protein [Novosphingobium sp. SG916]
MAIVTTADHEECRRPVLRFGKVDAVDIGKGLRAMNLALLQTLAPAARGSKRMRDLS